ncbi:hypothetical protein [Acidithiobacillus sp.]|uniref:hypothetical protein n=1 Tax=Acidithiobacillus sp. TaxID=1872118 RepID=UPI003D046C2A
MKKIKYLLFSLAVVSPLAFAGGPITNVPMKVQLHQEALDIHVAVKMLDGGAPVSQVMSRMQMLDFALQNTAAQMHTKAPLMPVLVAKSPTRADLIGVLKRDGRWVKTERAAQ